MLSLAELMDFRKDLIVFPTDLISSRLKSSEAQAMARAEPRARTRAQP